MHPSLTAVEQDTSEQRTERQPELGGHEQRGAGHIAWVLATLYFIRRRCVYKYLYLYIQIKTYRETERERERERERKKGSVTMYFLVLLILK